jgi:hypothetical protein
MNAIRIHRQLTSDTLPELRPWIGRSVEIIVLDDPAPPLPPGVTPGTGDWQAFQQAAEALRDSYDYAALVDQDALDLREAERNLKAYE